MEVDAHKQRGYQVAEAIQSALWAIDRHLSEFDKINGDLCVFQAEAPTGMQVRQHTHEAIRNLRTAENCFMAARRSLEVRGYFRVADDLAISEGAFDE